MDVEELFELARPYLERNDFGVAHTQRVFDIAQKNFTVPPELQDLTFSSIILHDIGGGSLRNYTHSSRPPRQPFSTFSGSIRLGQTCHVLSRRVPLLQFQSRFRLEQNCEPDIFGAHAAISKRNAKTKTKRTGLKGFHIFFCLDSSGIWKIL
jgi:hypothetical protein